jgi:adenine-specific DNA methylase
MNQPKLLIEEWLPAQAIGVECMRENSTGLHPPPNRLHVWWARRPLTISRAAVLGSLLPADFDRRTFERLLGFYGTGEHIVAKAAELANKEPGTHVKVGHGKRAFAAAVSVEDIERARASMARLWGDEPLVIDPMSGGGSIPLEAARMGLRMLANELNPVACSILEATVHYPFTHGTALARKARRWADIWSQRFDQRLKPFFRYSGFVPPRDHIFARTVPCPDTQYPTPLVPDWSLLRPNGGPHIVAEPVVNREKGTWTIRVRRVGPDAGMLRTPPTPTYKGGKGVSLFSGGPIPEDYIKAQAQLGRMGSQLYAVATKATTKLEFRPADETDLQALAEAEKELHRLRPQWERDGIIPTEFYPEVSTDLRPRIYGMPRWADLFSPRQLLSMGVLVEELLRLRPEIIQAEGDEMGEAIVHLLALVVDKFANYSSVLASWHAPRQVMRSVFDRHDFSFKPTFAEMAPCVSGGGLAWAAENVLDAYEKLAELPRAGTARPVEITQGSATNLAHLDDGSVTAVVVDPPYADNVQYAELADFFYVWLKRTQGHRRPEWFGTYLCDHDHEAVVNIARHASDGKKTKEAKAEAHAFYQRLMTDTFREARRVLRDDGVLTVMFTHKEQSAWAALFEALIGAGFLITATWPVQTESEHSLHQANRNAAQSSVILVARKRELGAGRGYFDDELRGRIRSAARETAARLQHEGFNPVDEMVGAFGAALRPFSAYDEVLSDTGERVGVDVAIQLAADAVSEWRIEQIAERGLAGVDPESRFVLLCWDVMQAAEFRFNEAMLLGRSVGMDVGALVDAGLVKKSGDRVVLLSARERRRDRPVTAEQTLVGPTAVPRRGRGGPRQVHPSDADFATAIDMCHALALRYDDAGRGQNGIGAAASLARQMGWRAGSPCDLLMAALLKAAPRAVRFPGKKGKQTAADRYPEFRAWHAMYRTLFGGEVEEWKEAPEPPDLFRQESGEDEEPEEEDEEGGDE